MELFNIKEGDLEALIKQLSQYPEALGDYRVWLSSQGINTIGMRPMGSAELIMRVFANRLKNGRAWSDKGMYAFIQFMVGLTDGLDIKTLVGTMSDRLVDDKPTDKKSKYYREKLTKIIGQSIRQNLAYLMQSTGKPVYQPLRLCGVLKNV